MKLEKGIVVVEPGEPIAINCGKHIIVASWSNASDDWYVSSTIDKIDKKDVNDKR